MHMNSNYGKRNGSSRLVLVVRVHHIIAKASLQCTMGIYPFMFGALKDFEPVVESITKAGLKEPYDWVSSPQEQHGLLLILNQGRICATLLSKGRGTCCSGQAC